VCTGETALIEYSVENMRYIAGVALVEGRNPEYVTDGEITILFNSY
jgi:hypothetical protein